MYDRVKMQHNSLGFHIGRSSRAVSRLLNLAFTAAGFDVTSEQWRVLVNLWVHDGLTQQELCDLIVQEKTGVSRLVSGLEKRGLVIRKLDPKDKRTRRVHLTDRGRSLQDGLMTLAKRIQAEAQAGIAPEELETCKDVLRRLYQNLQNLQNEYGDEQPRQTINAQPHTPSARG
jgi:DNA-binding MarR family transcriptional regulator